MVGHGDDMVKYKVSVDSQLVDRTQLSRLVKSHTHTRAQQFPSFVDCYPTRKRTQSLTFILPSMRSCSVIKISALKR